MKKLADNVLEYDEIGKLVEVYSQTFKTVKETYSDKKDAAKDVVKLKSKLLDSSGELADTASTLKGSLDAAKEMIGKVPARLRQTTHSSITVQNSWTTRQTQLRCRATAWNRYPRSRCISSLWTAPARR